MYGYQYLSREMRHRLRMEEVQRNTSSAAWNCKYNRIYFVLFIYSRIIDDDYYVLACSAIMYLHLNILSPMEERDTKLNYYERRDHGKFDWKIGNFSCLCRCVADDSLVGGGQYINLIEVSPTATRHLPFVSRDRVTQRYFRLTKYKSSGNIWHWKEKRIYHYI